VNSYTGLVLDGDRAGTVLAGQTGILEFPQLTSTHFSLTPVTGAHPPLPRPYLLRAVRVGVEGVHYWFWIYHNVAIADEVSYVFTKLIRMATKK
jgi:hypothetical protein